MKKFRYVWVYSNNRRFLEYIYNFNIFIFDSKKEDSKNVYKINYDDYIRIASYSYLDIHLHSYDKISAFLSLLKDNYVYIIIFTLFFINVYFLSNLIISIDIKSSNRYIEDLVRYELKQYDIRRLSFAKDYEYLENVKENILNNNKDTLEWISIKRNGMKYIVNVERRILNPINKNNSFCNIVAKREGVIMSSTIYSGVPIVNINDKVNKNDLLVMGEITFKDKVISRVCAKADIYANTWYSIKTSVPTFYYEKVVLKKHRYHLFFKYKNKNFQIFKNKYKDNSVKDTLLFRLFGIEVYLRKENKVKLIEKKYTDDELIDLAISNGLKKLNVIIDDKSLILQRNVLKKYANNSKMYLELFVSVKENIAEVQVLE